MMMTRRGVVVLVVCLVVAGASGLHAGVLKYLPVWDDSHSGIEAYKLYTHTLDCGQGSPGAEINGVPFTRVVVGDLPLSNFDFQRSSGGRSDHSGNAAHNVSGNVANLFTDMLYNGSNDAGGTATYTLSGLTPGMTYDTRIYTRSWGTSAGGRVSTVSFDTNGDTVPEDSVTLYEDNASQSPPGFADHNQAYALSYTFVAQSSKLDVQFAQQATNASWHFYGVSNEQGLRAAGRFAADDFADLYHGQDNTTLAASTHLGGVGGNTSKSFTVDVMPGQRSYLQAIGRNGTGSGNWGAFVSTLEAPEGWGWWSPTGITPTLNSDTVRWQVGQTTDMSTWVEPTETPTEQLDTGGNTHPWENSQHFAPAKWIWRGNTAPPSTNPDPQFVSMSAPLDLVPIGNQTTVRATLAGDNSFSFYVSPDPHALGTLIGTGGGWTGTPPTWDFIVPADFPMYLHVVGNNAGDTPNPAGFLGMFELIDGRSFAETGSSVLCTDTLDWWVNNLGFGEDMVRPTLQAVYGGSPWGSSMAEFIGSGAEWIWLGGPGNVPPGTVYFTARITAVPEPATMLLVGVGVLGLLRRRRTRA